MNALMYQAYSKLCSSIRQSFLFSDYGESHRKLLRSQGDRRTALHDSSRNYQAQGVTESFFGVMVTIILLSMTHFDVFGPRES